jgi:hypothetical protein
MHSRVTLTRRRGFSLSRRKSAIEIPLPAQLAEACTSLPSLRRQARGNICGNIVPHAVELS